MKSTPLAAPIEQGPLSHGGASRSRLRSGAHGPTPPPWPSPVRGVGEEQGVVGASFQCSASTPPPCPCPSPSSRGRGPSGIACVQRSAPPPSSEGGGWGESVDSEHLARPANHCSYTQAFQVGPPAPSLREREGTPPYTRWPAFPHRYLISRYWPPRPAPC